MLLVLTNSTLISVLVDSALSHVDEFLKNDIYTTFIDKYYVNTCDIDYINGGLFMPHIYCLKSILAVYC